MERTTNLRRYKANKKTRVLVGTVLEVEIGKKATALGRRRTFVVARSELFGGSMKMATMNSLCQWRERVARRWRTY